MRKYFKKYYLVFLGPASILMGYIININAPNYDVRSSRSVKYIFYDGLIIPSFLTPLNHYRLIATIIGIFLSAFLIKYFLDVIKNRFLAVFLGLSIYYLIIFFGTIASLLIHGPI